MSPSSSGFSSRHRHSSAFFNRPTLLLASSRPQLSQCPWADRQRRFSAMATFSNFLRSVRLASICRSFCRSHSWKRNPHCALRCSLGHWISAERRLSTSNFPLRSCCYHLWRHNSLRFEESRAFCRRVCETLERSFGELTRDGRVVVLVVFL